MKKVLMIGVICCSLFFMGSGCDDLNKPMPESSSGVKKTDARVKVQASGLTVEQENIKKRIELENMPGSIKHLYIMSAYSGQVLIYSTIKGKVTSSGKRLTPYMITNTNPEGIKMAKPFWFSIDGTDYATLEVLQDDGTYGNSIDYLYWFDSNNRYHQHYLSGGQIVHVSDQPLVVKNVILNMEITERN